MPYAIATRFTQGDTEISKNYRPNELIIEFYYLPFDVKKTLNFFPIQCCTTDHVVSNTGKVQYYLKGNLECAEMNAENSYY